MNTTTAGVSGLRGERTLIVQGRVLRGDEQIQKYCRERGLCTICGEIQTHKKVGPLYNRTWEPLTTTHEGKITVYKGHCIQATCYSSVDQVKEMLGEATAKKSPFSPRQHIHSGSSGSIPSSNPSSTKSQRKPFQPDNVYKPPPPLAPDLFAMMPVPPSELPRHATMDMSDLSGSRRQSGNLNSSSSGYLDASSGSGNLNNSINGLTLEDKRRHSSSLEGSNSSFSRSNMSSYTLPQQKPRPLHHPSGGGSSENEQLAAEILLETGIRDERTTSHRSSFDSQVSMPRGLAREHSQFLTESSSSAMMNDALTSLEEEKTNNELDQLKQHILEGDYVTFINEIDRRCSGGGIDMEEKVIVLEGLKLFRYHVVKDQLSRPTGVVIPGDGWVKTVTVKLGDCGADKEIVISCLLTFLTLSTLPGNYKKFIIRKGGVASVRKVLDDEYKDDFDVPSLVCALLMSLGLSERDGLNARFDDIATLVKRIVSLVTGDESGRDMGLRALFHFAFQRKKSINTHKSLSHDVKYFLSSDRNISALCSILKEDKIHETAVESALSLLWRLSGPKDNAGDADPLPISHDAFKSIIQAMETFDSISIREAGCGVLANMSMRDAFPSAQIEPALECIHGFLNPAGSSADKVDEGLATCALHAICNMLGDPSVPSVSLPVYGNLMEAILGAMGQFPASEELVEFACLAIAHSSRNNPAVKETVMLLGGFRNVKAAFEEFVTKRADDPSLEVKDAALCALASLTGCRAGAEAVVNSGLLEILETLLAVETDKDFALILNIVAINTKIAMENGPQASSKDVFQERPSEFSELLRGSTSEPEVVRVFQGLIGLGQPGLEVALGAAPQFAALIDSLSRQRSSQQVQECGCALLAELYYQSPYPPRAAWDSNSQREALQAVDRAMDSHQECANIQINGCLVILNLMLAMKEDGSDRSAADSMMERCWKQILESMTHHDSNKTVQCRAIEALCAALPVAVPTVLRGWTARIVRHVYQTLSHFPSDKEIQKLVLDLMMILLELNEGVESIGDPRGISAIFDLLRSTAGDVSGHASSVLAALVERDLMASNCIMELPNAIEELLTCMDSNQENLQLQINVASILENLVNFADSVAVAQLLQCGAIARLCNLMNIHRMSGDFIMYTSNVLSAMIPCLDEEMILGISDLIKVSLVDAIERHVEKADVEAAIFDALWACCQLADSFKRMLLEETRTRMILSSMQLNLGSAELQQSGCSLLWLLSGFGTGKERIGKFGGVPTIVNALLAHNDSTAVQKEGLIALKNLAIASSNKPMLVEAEAENAVICSLWIHYKDPQVISIGLSVMNNIAVDSQTRSVAEMNEQTLLIVLSAMSHFPLNADVQKNACFYLKSCSYLPVNLQLMRSKGDQLIALLLKAADDYPEQCQERAASIVTKMQAT